MAARLPDFLVIGAYKCGTTTLHHALRQHPGLFLPSRKEPNFFAFEGMAADDHPAAATSIRDLDSYTALFDSAPSGARVGEVSPAYMANSVSVKGIYERIPDAKLVAIIRNPIDRAYSDFLMYVRDGVEPYRDFGRALDEQDQRRAAGLPTGHYISTGFYGAQLEPFVEAFGRQRLHVVLMEDFAADQRTVLQEICRFLGVDDGFVPEREDALNVSGVPVGRLSKHALKLRHRAAPRLKPFVPVRAKHAVDRILQRGLLRPPLPADQRIRLGELYRSDGERLERLLERPLPSWR
jgi:hypothetical protein